MGHGHRLSTVLGFTDLEKIIVIVAFKVKKIKAIKNAGTKGANDERKYEKNRKKVMIRSKYDESKYEKD